MGVIERDPYTGHGTTGHEWNGIKELNTRVPWPVWAFLIASVCFAILWWILMPAWPVGTTYTKGVLGDDVRKDVVTSLENTAQVRSAWTGRLERESFAAIQADPALMKDVRAAGHALFGDNCAACHGINGQGGPGFPDLADRVWLWGGDPATVFQTIRVGINSEHPDSRVSQMPAWGRDAMLARPAILNVVDYVYALSHGSAGASAASLAAGRKVYADNCAACHGTDARGMKDTGAPDLRDAFWLYGGSKQAIYDSVYGGRQGHMPTWEKRLTDTDRKILTLYVLDLGQRAQ